MTTSVDVLAVASSQSIQFFAQVRRSFEWQTIVHADKNHPDLLGKPVIFGSQDKALEAGRRAWGPIDANEGVDYRAAVARAKGA